MLFDQFNSLFRFDLLDYASPLSSISLIKPPNFSQFLVVKTLEFFNDDDAGELLELPHAAAASAGSPIDKVCHMSSHHPPRRPPCSPFSAASYRWSSSALCTLLCSSTTIALQSRAAGASAVCTWQEEGGDRRHIVQILEA